MCVKINKNLLIEIDYVFNLLSNHYNVIKHLLVRNQLIIQKLLYINQILYFILLVKPYINQT